VVTRERSWGQNTGMSELTENKLFRKPSTSADQLLSKRPCFSVVVIF
jgi:hypothetical protein